MRTLIFRLRHYYGRDLYYPHNTQAKILCEAFKVKTLTEFQIEKLEQAGIPLTAEGPTPRTKKGNMENGDELETTQGLPEN